MIRIRDSYQAPGSARVTWALLLLNILSYFAARYGVGHTFEQILYMGGVFPAELWDPQFEHSWGSGPRNAFVSLIWYQFLHGGFFHLLSNMLGLAIFGPNLERFMGPRRFLFFYLTCGAAGAMLHVLIMANSALPLIGASGAISGLFGAYMSVFPTNQIRITLGNMHRGYYRDLVVPVKVILIVWALSQMMDLVFSQINNVAYLAHLGGFLAGYVLGKGKSGSDSTRRRFKVFMGGKAR